MEQQNEVAKSSAVMAKEMKEGLRESFTNKVAGAFQPHQEQRGLPFLWAAVFMLICLFAIFLGHYLTITGQTVLQNMQQKMAPAPAQAPQTPTVLRVEPSKEATQRTEHALGTIATSLDGTSQNMNKLVDAVNQKFAKVQEQIVSLGEKLDSIPKEGGPVDLTEIKTALTSLSTSVSSNKNVETIVSSIKENATRQDQAFRQLTTTVQELQKAVKEKSATEELRVNSTLGEKFPPPKK
jgi:methyl-accepting chemotaxis protein